MSHTLSVRTKKKYNEYPIKRKNPNKSQQTKKAITIQSNKSSQQMQTNLITMLLHLKNSLLLNIKVFKSQRRSTYFQFSQCQDG